MRPGGAGRICVWSQREDTAMATRTNPLQFVQQVRAEVAKVVWPTRREVLLTSAMVLALSAVAAAFFFLVDFLIRQGLQLLLSLVG